MKGTELSSFTQRPRRQSVARSATIALLGLAGLLWWDDNYKNIDNDHNVNPLDDIPGSGFSWHQITPSPSIEYHDCFDGFQCARMEVPMDYNRGDGQGCRVAVALTRLPAKVPVTDPRYGGAVLINPGGPGGSGVMQVLTTGRELQTIVDAEGSPDTTESTTKAKYFDVIGFDPRGVNNTTPGFSCFPDLSSQVAWELQTEADGMLGSSESSLMRHWQRAQALNRGCSLNLATPPAGEDEALGHHVNTVPVARDMLEITERHAEWREKQGQIKQALHDNIHGHDPEQHIVAHTRWHRNHEKLLFWGRSYGTVLGITFATLHPDRISRMVLDGVVDVDKYYTGNGPNPVRDADAIFDRFGLYCDAVGPEACPLYTTGGPTFIKEAFLALDEKVYNASIPVMASSTHGPEVITWTDIRTLLRIALYQPIFAFPLFAQYLGQLSNGDGSAMVDFKQGNHRSSCPSNQCQLAGPWSTACRDPGENEDYATAAILCSDAEYMGDIDEDGFKGYWDGLKRDSKMLGDYWAHIRMSCVGWKAKAKWKISGPFTANTTHPLLFISNNLDPVTPLYSAQKMSQKFPGSVVLRQDSEGHTSGASPSLCIAKGIRQYFQSGELPDADVVCEADMKPLLGSTIMIKEGMTEGEKVLMQAMMNEVQRVRRGPL